MILEIKLKDGTKTVFGGDFTFCVNSDKILSIRIPNSEIQIENIRLKDCPTYNVGGSIVYCEEAKDD